MTYEQQLARWVAGESIHNGPKSSPKSSCTPDFSCCKPELLQPVEVRRAFVAANDRERNRFLGMFLSAAIALAAPRKRVHITGHRDPSEGDS